MLHIDIRKKLKVKSAANELAVTADIVSDRITAVYGSSGIGKSTLFHCIAGLTQPDRGIISFEKESWYDDRKNICIPVQARNIAYIFQSNNLFPHLTVAENIRFALKPSDKNSNIRELLIKSEVEGMEQRYPDQLSGGEQQKVAIARMLAQKSKLALMDEPFSALDHAMRRRLYSLIRGFKEQYGLTILLATHDLQDIRSLADQILWITEDRQGVLLGKEAFFDRIR